MRDVVNVAYQMLNPGSKPLALDDDYYDLRWAFTNLQKKMKTFFRDTVTTVELLLLRILEFKIPEADFFSYLVKFLYSLEKWCHGRQCEANQDIVKLFQAVSRSQGVTYSSNVSRPFKNFFVYFMKLVFP